MAKVKQKLKHTESQLLKNVISVMPLVEEITEKGLIPMCLIGFSVDDKEKKVRTLFSTLHNDHDRTVYEVCKKLVESQKHLYEKE